MEIDPSTFIWFYLYVHIYRLAADVKHWELANANSQSQAMVGMFHNIAVQYQIYADDKDNT